MASRFPSALGPIFLRTRASMSSTFILVSFALVSSEIWGERLVTTGEGPPHRGTRCGRASRGASSDVRPAIPFWAPRSPPAPLLFREGPLARARPPLRPHRHRCERGCRASPRSAEIRCAGNQPKRGTLQRFSRSCPPLHRSTCRRPLGGCSWRCAVHARGWDRCWSPIACGRRDRASDHRLLPALGRGSLATSIAPTAPRRSVARTLSIDSAQLRRCSSRSSGGTPWPGYPIQDSSVR